MCTLVTQMFCSMCHTQELWLFSNNIGDAGLTALAKAAESGALAQLNTLSLRKTHIGDASPSSHLLPRSRGGERSLGQHRSD
jgi:hypothetical protein